MRPVVNGSADVLGHRPVYSWLVQFPVVCFIGALMTDLYYVRTDVFIWETFSVWLLAFGCLMAGLAGVVGLISLVSNRRLREWRFAWPHALVSLAAALLSVVNAFVHSRDGYTAVMPAGLTLSIIVVVLMLIAGTMTSLAGRTVQMVGVPA